MVNVECRCSDSVLISFHFISGDFLPVFDRVSREIALHKSPNTMMEEDYEKVITAETSNKTREKRTMVNENLPP